jgi:hypothetical protein
MNPLGFTRDGSFFYGTGFFSRQDVYVADLDPATGRALSKPERISQRSVGRSGLAVAWSSDGQFLAYTRESGENVGRVDWTTARIIIRSDRTGEERELVPVPPLQREFSIVEMLWFPDGRSLLAQVIDSSRHLLFQRIDVNTGQVAPLLDLKAASENVSYPSLSHDGKTLFYVQKGGKGRPPRLMRRNLDTGETKELYRPTSYLESPTVSPDGREVLFQGSYQDQKTMSLLIVPAEGGVVRELYRSRDYIADHIWSNDGRRVWFAPMLNSDTQQLWSIPIEGGEPQPTGLSLPVIYTLALRPDGRRIAIGAGGENVLEEVWVVRNLLSAPKAPRK